MVETLRYTFDDLTRDAQSGKSISAEQHMAEILAAAKLADAAVANICR